MTHHPCTRPRLAKPPARTTALGWCTALALVGCGGGGGGGTDPTSTPADTPALAASAVVAEVAASAVAGAASAAAEAASAPSAALAIANAEATAAAMALQAQTSLAAEAAAALQAEKAATNATNPPLETPTPAAPPAAVEAPVASPSVALAGSTSLVVRARGTPAGGVAPLMQVRVNGNTVGNASVTATQWADYRFPVPNLAAGSVVDVVFTNDATVGSEDRNLVVAWLGWGSQAVMPTATNAVIDRGVGAKAFDGLDTVPGNGNIYWNAALRLTWPAATSTDGTTSATTTTTLARQQDAVAVRFLLQASFGPTPADVATLVSKPYATWLQDQMALPWQPDHVNAVQAQWLQGDAWRPNGAKYDPTVVAQTFWKTAATAPDQLRKRVAFALHNIFMVSQADSNLWGQARAVAAYHDTLNKHAFGNFRQLLEDVALSPAMGIYLSHQRNRKEDPATGRVPDENFAREVMQLFTIGLQELNTDGSIKRDASGNPVETYTNADVMALAKVFTGWSWAFADAELTDAKFRWGNPDTSAAKDQRIDTLLMKPYPGQHSTAAKALFAGKAWGVNIPANGTAQADLALALDALFKHPNVGPFIGRQLIQRLVTSQPTPAYVARVAGVFNNNGSGVRGDLAAVVRAILLDTEARNAPPAGFGKLREPVLRVAHWMRALGATSASGTWAMAWELDNTGQRALAAPSVFGHFRPGHVPPNTSFATAGSTAPEFQIVNESTVAAWINTAEAMAGSGLGWNGSANDVRVDYAALGALAAGGNLSPLIDRLDLLLLGGRMPAALRSSLMDTIGSVASGSATTHADRARAASFLVLASPQFISQP